MIVFFVPSGSTGRIPEDLQRQSVTCAPLAGTVPLSHRPPKINATFARRVAFLRGRRQITSTIAKSARRVILATWRGRFSAKDACLGHTGGFHARFSGGFYYHPPPPPSFFSLVLFSFFSLSFFSLFFFFPFSSRELTVTHAVRFFFVCVRVCVHACVFFAAILRDLTGAPNAASEGL